MNGWNGGGGGFGGGFGGGGFGGGFGGNGNGAGGRYGGGDRDSGLRPDGGRLPPRKIDPRTVRRIIGSFRPYRWKVTAVLTGIALSALFGLVSSLLVRRVFDGAIAQKNLSKLVFYTMLMLFAPVIGNLINFGQSILNMRIGQNVMRDFRTRLFVHIQKMPIRFFAGTRAGEIQSRITNDVGGVQRVLTDTGTQVVGNLITVVSTVIAISAFCRFFSSSPTARARSAGRSIASGSGRSPCFQASCTRHSPSAAPC
jgi:ATP-binding cassette subfamily B protein